jgi:hypothetical protein
MHSVTRTLKLGLALAGLVLIISCSHQSQKLLHVRELEIDSLEDTMRSESSLWSYLMSRSFSHRQRRKDSVGYDEVFAPAFIRGVPGYLILIYSNHSRSDTMPKVGFSWVANDLTFALADDSVRQNGFENVEFGSRQARFDTLAMRLARFYNTPFYPGSIFIFKPQVDLVLMDDSALSIDIRSHHLAR